MCVPSLWHARLGIKVITVTLVHLLAPGCSTPCRRGPGIAPGEVRLRTLCRSDQGHVRESNPPTHHCYLPDKRENGTWLLPNVSQCIGIVEVSFAKGDDFPSTPTCGLPWQPSIADSGTFHPAASDRAVPCLLAKRDAALKIRSPFLSLAHAWLLPLHCGSHVSSELGVDLCFSFSSHWGLCQWCFNIALAYYS